MVLMEVPTTLAWMTSACSHYRAWTTAWGQTQLRTYLALENPGREPKVNMWRARSGLLPSEWKVGGKDMLLAWLLGMLSLPTPRQPSAPAMMAGPRLFCSLRRSTGSWWTGKAEKTCLSQI